MNIILNKEDVENLLKMLASPDKENQILALTTIENLDYNENLGAILILYRNGYLTYEDWFLVAKNCCLQVIDKISHKGSIIKPSYLACLYHLKLCNEPKRHLELVFEFYKEDARDNGYIHEIEEVLNKINLNYERTNKERTTCKS